MNDDLKNLELLEENLESIEERIRTGKSIDDVDDIQLKGAAEALRLIQRVKSQQARDTLLDRETVFDTDGTAFHPATP